jgi:hypothetical protein
MTEAEWLQIADVRALVGHLFFGLGDRKARLFACACCRRVWHLLGDPRSYLAVQTVERVEDGWAGEEERTAAKCVARAAVDEVRERYPYPDYLVRAEHSARMAVWMATERTLHAIPHVASHAADAVGRQALAAAVDRTDLRASRLAAEQVEKQRQADLYRDIAGNPFRPVRIDPDWLSWREGTIPKIAHALYDERAFDRLPILADALEDAGCSNDDILQHCREPGEHVRGCWVVDLLTGRC